MIPNPTIDLNRFEIFDSMKETSQIHLELTHILAAPMK